MAQIQSTIDGVTVEFASGIGNDVDHKLVEGLKHCIKTQIAPGHVLTRIYVSSAYDSHKMPSRHMLVGREATTAKFWLSPVRQAYNYGFAAKELARIQNLVQQHETELLKAWHEYFKPSDRSGHS